MSEKVSPWAKPDHTPCPTHGREYFDENGWCLPSCGFGWDRDPLLIVRDEAVAEASSALNGGRA